MTDHDAHPHRADVMTYRLMLSMLDQNLESFDATLAEIGDCPACLRAGWVFAVWAANDNLGLVLGEDFELGDCEATTWVVAKALDLVLSRPQDE